MKKLIEKLIGIYGVKFTKEEIISLYYEPRCLELDKRILVDYLNIPKSTKKFISDKLPESLFIDQDSSLASILFRTIISDISGLSFSTTIEFERAKIMELQKFTSQLEDLGIRSIVFEPSRVVLPSGYGRSSLITAIVALKKNGWNLDDIILRESSSNSATRVYFKFKF